MPILISVSFFRLSFNKLNSFKLSIESFDYHLLIYLNPNQNYQGIQNQID